MKSLRALVILWVYIRLTISCNCFAQELNYIRDSSSYFISQQSPGELKPLLKDQKFSAQPDRRFNFGLTTNAFCYIIVKIKASRPLNTYFLSIDNTSLDTVFIYGLSDTSKALLYKGGNLVKYAKDRNYVWHTIPLEISNEFHYYMIAIKAVSKNVNVQYKILQGEDLQKLYRGFDRIISFYLGIISFIASTSLLGFVLFRDKRLLLYLAYIIAITSWILAHYGYLFPLFYPSFPPLNEIIKPVASLFAVIFFLSLINYLLKKEFTKNFFSNGIVILQILSILLILIGFIHLIIQFNSRIYTLYNILWHVLLISSVCFVVTMLLAIPKASKTASIFTFAIALLLTMALIQVFSNAGYLKSSFLNDHGILLVNLLEILILSFGIVYSLWNERRQKDQQLRLLEEEQKTILQKFISLQDNERKRIAEELHDSIGPMLAAIKINFLRAVKAKSQPLATGNLVEKTESIIDDSIAEIRNISHQLMPKGLSSKGLITLLSEYFNDLQTVYPTSVQFSHKLSASLDQDLQLNLYRIMSELVLNAARHSGSQTISVSIETSETEIIIEVRDDGKGFDKAQRSESSLGLKNIESRVNYLKGELQIVSADKLGTQIKITIPRKSY